VAILSNNTTTIVRPAPLQCGDLACVTAPAGPVPADLLRSGLDRLASRYTVCCDDRLTDRNGYLAGVDSVRLSGLQEALDHVDAAAVISTRGGYGTTRILDSLDLTSLSANPKWIVGSSDLTALLLRLWTDLRMLSIHGPMVARFAATEDNDVDDLFRLLEGGAWSAPDGLEPICYGAATGPLIGGNLTMLAHLCGAVDPVFAGGAILFIEDVGEKPYRIDRCLVQLRRSGILPRLVGVLLGEFTDCEPGDDGVTVKDVLKEHLTPLRIPVAGLYPAAHGGRNAPFIHGGTVVMEVDSTVVRLKSARDI
jgi:muramoyltetrapeptide carboxypeptidase